MNDFRLGSDTEGFRAEVRAFLADVLAEAGQHSDPTDLTGLDAAFERDVQTQAGARGWLGGLAPEQRFVFESEVARADAPLVDTAIGNAGHAITTFASPEMQEWLLPQMRSGAAMVCIAYTEEGAGNDLSQLAATASPSGDGGSDGDGHGWILCGRKVLITAAHKADYCVTVARTATDAPLREAMTMFLVDMRAAGVTVARRPTMNGWTLGDISFNDVHLGPDSVIGTVGAGWRQLNSAVATERTGTYWLGFSQHLLELLIERVRTADGPAGPLRGDPIALDALGRCAVLVADAERLCRRALWSAVTPGGQDHAMGSMVKLVCTELLQQLAQTASELAGEAGLVWAPPFAAVAPGAAAGGRFAWEYLERVHGAISVGSNELQRDLIASIGLGLPRRKG